MPSSHVGSFFRFFVLLFVIPDAEAAAPDAARQLWDETVKAAREEGRLTIYGTTIFEDVFKFFQKAYPEIKLSFVVGRGADVARDSCRKDEQLDYLVLAVGKPQASKSHLTTWFSCSGVKSHPAKRIFAPASLTLLPVSLPSSNGESRKSTR
jgi:hypothetical protein